MSHRQTTIVCLRAIALSLFVAALITAAAGLAREHIAHPQRFIQWWWQRSTELCWSIPIAVTAIAIWVLQRPLSRLIAPKPKQGCPECGYDLRGLKSNTCPECGHEFRK